MLGTEANQVHLTVTKVFYSSFLSQARISTVLAGNCQELFPNERCRLFYSRWQRALRLDLENPGFRPTLLTFWQ